MTDTPHFSWPFTRGAGTAGVVTVDQDTHPHRLSQAAVVAVCQLGAREDRPEFGWNQPAFTGDANLEELGAALAEFAPDADYTLKDLSTIVELAQGERSVEVEVRS